MTETGDGLPTRRTDMSPAAGSRPSLRHARPQHVMSARAPRPGGGEEEYAAALGRLLHAVWRVLESHNVIPPGPPFVRHHDDELEAGFPVISPLPDDGDVRAGELPGGELAVALHRGAYDGLPATRAALADWIRQRRLAPAAPGWEVYLDDPAVTGPEQARTELVVPVAPRTDGD